MRLTPKRFNEKTHFKVWSIFRGEEVQQKVNNCKVCPADSESVHWSNASNLEAQTRVCVQHKSCCSKPKGK